MDIERWCRICSIEVNCGVFLFGDEAKRTFLHAKIRKYLSVSVRTIFVFVAVSREVDIFSWCFRLV